jgi:C-terminal processing protease CtpA/Prc
MKLCRLAAAAAAVAAAAYAAAYAGGLVPERRAASADDAHTTASASFLGDVDELERILLTSWANREVHAQLDRVDTAAVMAGLRQRVGADGSAASFAIALREALSELGDAHVAVQATPGVPTLGHSSDLGFVRVAEGVALAWANDQVYGRAGGPEAGDVLVAVDGHPFEDFVRGQRLRAGSTPAGRREAAIDLLSWQLRFSGEVPSPERLTLARADGSRYELEVRWRAPAEAPRRRLAHEPCASGRMLDEAVGYLKVRTFWCTDVTGAVDDEGFERQLSEAARAVESATALLVDLRRNGGGNNRQSDLTAALLLDRPTEWIRVRRRPNDGSAAPRARWVGLDLSKPPLRGQPTFLTGPECASACAIFVSAFRARGGVTFVGEPAESSAGDPTPFVLPRSGFTVRVPTLEVYVAGSDGDFVEGKVIQPDWHIETKASDLRAGHDRVREEARALARREAR